MDKMSYAMAKIANKLYNPFEHKPESFNEAQSNDISNAKDDNMDGASPAEHRTDEVKEKNNVVTRNVMSAG